MQKYRASAPGSLMLIGEHAVLWGSKCLVAAVDYRLTVTLESRYDDTVTFKSELFPVEYVTLLSLTDLAHSVLLNFQHRFAIATLFFYRSYLSQGFDLIITSEIHDKKGFGSSAAVVAATQAVVLKFCRRELSLIEKVRDARAIIQLVQEYGSGADVAASIFGGIIAYQIDPIEIESIICHLPLTVLFSGHKTPTSTVIRYVQAQIDQTTGLKNLLLVRANIWVERAITALANCDIPALAAAFENYADIMIAMGVEDTACRQALDFLRQQPGIIGAKISGSGLGDCVIGCGILDPILQLPSLLRKQNMEIIAIKLTNQGVSDESC